MLCSRDRRLVAKCRLGVERDGRRERAEGEYRGTEGEREDARQGQGKMIVR